MRTRGHEILSSAGRFDVLTVDRCCVGFQHHEIIEDIADIFGLGSMIAVKYHRRAMLAAVKEEGTLLEYASERLQSDAQVVLAAVQQDGRALKFAARDLCGNLQVVLAAVQQDGGSLGDASTELQGDRKVVLAAVKRTGGALIYASKELQSDLQVVRAAVSQDGTALAHASKELRSASLVVFAAVEQCGRALMYASKDLQNDFEVARVAVNQDGWSLRFASKELQGNRKLVLVAVEKEGEALKCAHEDMRGDKDLVLAAVRSYPPALEFASQEIREDPDVLLAAAASASTFQWVDCFSRGTPIPGFLAEEWSWVPFVSTQWTPRKLLNLAHQRDASHRAFFVFLSGTISAAAPFSCLPCPLTVTLGWLGEETVTTLKRSIAEYAGVPYGAALRTLRFALKCFESWGKFNDDDPIPKVETRMGVTVLLLPASN